MFKEALTRIVVIALLVTAASALVCTATYGSLQGHIPAFITITWCWYLVVIAVGDQILKNWVSGRAAQQLAWNTFLSNLFENVGWTLLTHATGDPVYLLSRVLGLIFDQVVFWQMLVSSAEGVRLGTIAVLLRYASIPLLLVIFSLCGVPYLIPEIRSEGGVQFANVATFVLWAWTAAAWGLQIHKNARNGVITGRDFSLWIPALIQIYMCSAIANEFFGGTNRLTPYICLSIGLTINTILMLQTFFYRKAWRRLSLDEREQLVKKLNAN